MKNLIKLLLVSILGFVSCKEVVTTKGIKWPNISVNYINTYMDTDAVINATQVFPSDVSYVTVWLYGDRICYDPEGPKGRFKELSEKYNDLQYNQRILEPWGYEALADEFMSIDVVSDRDWDAEHPAGTSLANIITFLSSSPYRFIQSSYTDAYDWVNAPEEYINLRLGNGPGSWPIEKPLNELTREDLILTAPQFILHFDSLPASEQEHNLTITLRSDEKTISGTFAVTF